MNKREIPKSELKGDYYMDGVLDIQTTKYLRKWHSSRNYSRCKDEIWEYNMSVTNENMIHRMTSNGNEASEHV